MRHHVLTQLGLTCLLLLSAAAQAKPAPTALNDTGLLFCVDRQNQPADCAGSGQDGAFGRDLSHPRRADGWLGLQFQRICHSGEPAGQGQCPARPEQGPGANQWACTRDQVTGLLWELKTADGGLQDWHRGFTHFSVAYDPKHHRGDADDAQGYVDAINQMALCGQTHWRLPQAQELMGLAVLSRPLFDRLEDARYFPYSAYPPNYLAADADTLVRGDFHDQLGTVWAGGMIRSTERESPQDIRLVQGAGPQSFQAATGQPRWRISADGNQSHDRLSGLTWRRCVEGQHWNGQTCAGSVLDKDFFGALHLADKAARAEGLAWRLPNIKELASVLDGRFLEGVDPTVFPGYPGSGIWSNSVVSDYRIPFCISSFYFNAGLCGSSNAAHLVREGR